MRELHAAAWRRGEAVVELVADTVHVHLDLVADVVNFVQQTNPLGVVFVTDAMEGAGMPDGQYILAARRSTSSTAWLRLSRNGAIAGGTARVAEEVQRMVGGGYLQMPAAVCCGVGAPAHAVGADTSRPRRHARVEGGRAGQRRRLH